MRKAKGKKSTKEKVKKSATKGKRSLAEEAPVSGSVQSAREQASEETASFDQSLEKRSVPRTSRLRLPGDEVRVISLDRIVLGKKWTSRLGLEQGDTLKVKQEGESLILTK